MRITGLFRDIPADRRIPDYGARGILRVCNSTFSSTVGVLKAPGGMSRGNTARLVQRVVNGAWEAASTVWSGYGVLRRQIQRACPPRVGAALHLVRGHI